MRRTLFRELAWNRRCSLSMRRKLVPKHVRESLFVFVILGSFEMVNAYAVLELAGNAARDNKKTRVVPRHIQLTVRNDEELVARSSDDCERWSELYMWGRDEGDGRPGLGVGRGPNEGGGLRNLTPKLMHCLASRCTISCGGFFTMAIT
ncbi:hypothetical protein Syun_012842 [Stephania yunnanensis]|uniref:Histone H2A n=1 Tax=Stephania yunnanensis TaxID=152371 RepID=A0AAP0K080_9MAGN